MMLYFGYIKSAIRKKKFFTILSSIQIIITMILIIELLVSISTINYKEKELRSNLNIDLNKTYQFLVYGDSSGIVNYKNEIANHMNIGSYRYEICKVNEFMEDEKFINIEKELEDVDNSYMRFLKLDKNIFDLLDIDIVDGRKFNESDFELKDDVIPILFSEVYRDVVKIGDEITCDNITTEVYEVIGFFDKNTKWIPSNGIEFFGLEDLGKMAITIPSKEEKSFPLYERSILNSTYITSNNLNKDQIKMIINQINENYKLNSEVLSIKDVLNRFKKENYPLIMQNLFFCVFMFISACLGLATNMSYTIMNRKREFGIRMANGFRKWDIKLLVLSEMVFLTTISSIIAIIIKFIEIYQNRAMSIAEKILVPQFTGKDFIITIILIIIIIALASIIPLRNIDKLQPRELIGGND